MHQIPEIRKCPILVGTPGRLLDFMESGVIDLSETRQLVLDEADRMLDMGFQRELDRFVDFFCFVFFLFLFLFFCLFVCVVVVVVVIQPSSPPPPLPPESVVD